MLATEMNRCVRIPNGIVTVGGDPLALTAFGKTYRFEWHNYCGPMFCTKNGAELKNPPDENNPWWKAFEWWDRQGKRTENGVCVWDEIPVCPSCNGTGIGERINRRNVYACKSCHGTGEAKAQ